MMKAGLTSMQRKEQPRHIDSFPDRYGKMRYYFRRGKGPRIKLPGAPGSTEFEEAYATALAGSAAEKRQAAKGVVPRSIAALINSYRASSDFKKLRATSRSGYQSRLKILEDKHGQRSVSGLDPIRIEKMIMLPYANRPGQAHALLKMLRVLIRHAIHLRWLDRDPSVGLKRATIGQIRSWTEAEIKQFEDKWPIGSKQRLAFALFLYTGQRRSDVHRMTWRDVTDRGISIKQQKTGAELLVPVHSELQIVLDKAREDRTDLVLLTTSFGEMFTVDGFSQWMRDAIRDAALPISCQPHGLRKAAGRRLAEAGCSAHEIMSILGHRSLAEAERYTKEADQKRLAAAAISRLEGQTGNKRPKPKRADFPKPAKTPKIRDKKQ
jgi:integrase